MKTAKAVKGHCDRIVSRIIRERAGWKCQKCGSTDNIQCCHILSRSYSVTRCYQGNLLAMCASCHHLFTIDPVSFGKFVIERIGEDGYQALRDLANSGQKVDWSIVLEDLKIEAKKLGVSTA